MNTDPKDEQVPNVPPPTVKRDKRGGIQVDPSMDWMKGLIARMVNMFGAEAQDKTSEPSAWNRHQRRSKSGHGGRPARRGNLRRGQYGKIRRTMKREAAMW